MNRLGLPDRSDSLDNKWNLTWSMNECGHLTSFFYPMDDWDWQLWTILIIGYWLEVKISWSVGFSVNVLFDLMSWVLTDDIDKEFCKCSKLTRNCLFDVTHNGVPLTVESGNWWLVLDPNKFVTPSVRSLLVSLLFFFFLFFLSFLSSFSSHFFFLFSFVYFQLLSEVRNERRERWDLLFSRLFFFF